MLQIYCGDGKGKTTAALGLALRCAGSGKKVHIMQFMKGNISSEIYALRQIDNITVQRCDKNYGFTKTMTSADKTGITACHNEMLYRVQSLIAEHKADMLILDEFNNAFHYGLLDKSLAEKVILSASLSGHRTISYFSTSMMAIPSASKEIPSAPCSVKIVEEMACSPLLTNISTE